MIIPNKFIPNLIRLLHWKHLRFIHRAILQGHRHRERFKHTPKVVSRHCGMIKENFRRCCVRIIRIEIRNRRHSDNLACANIHHHAACIQSIKLLTRLRQLIRQSKLNPQIHRQRNRWGIIRRQISIKGSLSSSDPNHIHIGKTNHMGS